MQKDSSIGFRKLIVWQKADELAFKIYVVTKNFPKDELFALTSQMRRAALSVPANIVEGYARNSRKEKLQFCAIARASLTELEYYIEFAFRLNYCNEDSYTALVKSREEVGRILNGFIKAL
jgi:four helix bundle protein